jgi:hypothetical protein
MDAASLTRMERLNYLFGGILVIVTAVLTRRDQALGAAVGVALTCLNFAFLRRLVFRWTASVKAGDEQGGRRMFLILPKMIGLMAAVVLSLWLLPIDAIFFVIGYSVFILSIVTEGILGAVRPAPSEDPSAPTDPSSDGSNSHSS